MASRMNGVVNALLASAVLFSVGFGSYHVGTMHGASSVDRRVITPSVSFDESTEEAFRELAEEDDNDEQVRASPTVNPKIVVSGVETKSNDFFPSNHAVGNEDGCPSSGYDDLVEITGGSMRPAIWDGNHVMLEDREEGEEVQPGSIVSTKNDVLHAVEAVYEDGEELYLKGYDNAEKDSTPVGIENVSGVAVGVCYT